MGHKQHYHEYWLAERCRVGKEEVGKAILEENTKKSDLDESKPEFEFEKWYKCSYWKHYGTYVQKWILQNKIKRIQRANK